jgi:hypothetical protein
MMGDVVCLVGLLEMLEMLKACLSRCVQWERRNSGGVDG